MPLKKWHQFTINTYGLFLINQHRIENYPDYLFCPIFPTAHHRLVSVEDDNSVITFIEYQVLIGNRKWIKEKNFIDIPNEIDEKMKKQEELGHTALLVAIDGKNERKKNH